MNRLDKIAHQLLCDIEEVPTLAITEQLEIKLDLIRDAIRSYHERSSMSPELKQWMEDQFQIFWLKYGKRIGRTPAIKKWMKLKEDDVVRILETVNEFVLINSDVQFRPHPVTYINQRRWEDELPSSRKPLPRRETKQNTWQL